MITEFIGVEYARGAGRVARNGGPALAPRAIQKMLPDANWTILTAPNVAPDIAAADRFGDAAVIQKMIYNATPATRHIFIGGDHSVNFGHFAAVADHISDDVCLVYVDAHLDIHTPETSRIQASGAPHGTNVRADLGTGDVRWLNIARRRPALRPENLFFIGTRSFESAEYEFVRTNNIFMRHATDIDTPQKLNTVITEIRHAVGTRPFVLSFDFDAIDPKYFPDVWVPEPAGITPTDAETIIRAFSDAHSFEFVEYAVTGDTQSAQIAEHLVKLAMGA